MSKLGPVTFPTVLELSVLLVVVVLLESVVLLEFVVLLESSVMVPLPMTPLLVKLPPSNSLLFIAEK